MKWEKPLLFVPFMLAPPFQEHVSLYQFCYKTCLAKYIGSEEDHHKDRGDHG